MSPTGQGGELLAEGQVLEDEISSRAHGERSVGRRATRRRSIEPGRIQGLWRIVNGSSVVGVLARHRPQDPPAGQPAYPQEPWPFPYPFLAICRIGY